jgi:hypothetical protein
MSDSRYQIDLNSLSPEGTCQDSGLHGCVQTKSPWKLLKFQDQWYEDVCRLDPGDDTAKPML